MHPRMSHEVLAAGLADDRSPFQPLGQKDRSSTQGLCSTTFSAMARTVHCVKFDKEMEGLEKPPLKGPVGQRVFDSVSKEAWRLWLEHSKMLVNEYRIDLISPAGQKTWMDELEKYFFGEGSQLPPDFNPQKAK
jgi:Fe-S cluster biosynthesis and repair protein YggX